MKTIVSYEQVQCDICGQNISKEPGTMFIESVYVGDKYLSGVVNISAVYLGEETKCLCNNCRKQILERAIERLV